MIPNAKMDGCEIPERYQDFIIQWTGWIPDGDISVGQWLAGATHIHPIRTFYASYPGGEGEFRKGDHFDISLRDGQDPPVWGSHSDQHHGVKEAFQRLIKLLDKEFPDLLP